jgi:hypothetical protein
MAEKSEVYKEKLKHKGFFSYSDYYNFCYNWLKDEGYNIAEDEYTEKITGGGKEIQIKWKASKKVSDYVKNELRVEWHILGMSDAEVEVEGKKTKTNKGEVKITLTATIIKDYESRWDETVFLKFLRGVYDRYIIRETVKKYEDRLEDKAKDYIAQMKSFLNLEGKN